MTARGYFLIEFDPTDSDIAGRVGSLSLANALQLVHHFRPGELVAHVEGNDASDVSEAAHAFSKVEGVRRVSTMVLVT
jgi:hypothetical protein